MAMSNMPTSKTPHRPSEAAQAATSGRRCCSSRSPPRSSSAPPCCSQCSRCSPRWCCRASGAPHRCGRLRSCSFRGRCSRATPTPIGSRVTRPAAGGRRSSCGDDRRYLYVTAVDRPGMGPAAGGGGNGLADRAVLGFDRPAVLCARRQQPVAAGLVRAHRSPRRERSVFSLCRRQCRKLPRAHLLSGRGRAVRAAQRSGGVLVDRILPI